MKIGIFLDHLRDAGKQTGLPLESVAVQAANLGITFVHVNGEFWMENEERVDQLMKKTGLEVGSVDIMCQLTQGRDMEKVEKLIRFLSRKNVKHLLLIPGFIHEAQSRRSAMEQAAAHMKQLLYLARSMHVQCSLEDYDNSKAPFGTWQELKWYTEQLPELGISFDTGNFVYFAQDALEAYGQLESKICLVHAKDRRFAGRLGEEGLCSTDGRLLYPSPVGGGEMPMKEIFSKLVTSGFDGLVLIEHFGSADMLGDMHASVQWLKKHINIGE